MTENLLEFLVTIGNLKNTPRAGWVLRDVKDPESVSDHMYRMSIMAMTCCDEEHPLRIDHCIKLCLVHDVAECIVGDITPEDNISKQEKQEKEENAMTHLCSLLERQKALNLKHLFQEYESQVTAEAKFVKDLDRFDMILQAYQYEKETNNIGWLQEFFDSVEGKLQHPAIKKLAIELHKKRNQEKNSTK